MLSVKELRLLGSSLDQQKFKRQLGPFTLIQKPPKERLASRPKPAPAKPAPTVEENPWDDVGVQGTAMARPEVISQGILSIIFQFEDLLVATLPPLHGVDELTVGRLPDCDLVLDEPSVSKRHAVLVWDEEAKRCLVKDLGSTNGTYLNGAKLSREATLRDGDIVSFGEAQFWFLLTGTLHSRLVKSGSTGLGRYSV